MTAKSASTLGCLTLLLAVQPMAASATTIRGTSGDDVLRGTDGQDVIRPGSGDDRVFGGDRYDFIVDDFGRDYLRGGNGRDTLAGGHHSDVLNGGWAYDRLYGGDGGDVLIGGPGNAPDNFSRAGRGADTLVFGRGVEQGSANRGGDVILLHADGRADYVDCGSGIDTVWYSGAIEPRDMFRRCDAFIQTTDDDLRRRAERAIAAALPDD